MVEFHELTRSSEFDAVSLDLETMGTDPGDGILSIGMVEFSTLTGKQGDMFYVSFKAQDWLDRGYTFKQSTLDWWAHPEQEKARFFLSPSFRRPIDQGLKSALDWLAGRDLSGGLWSRGYMDETMLKMAMRHEIDVEEPWHYRAAHDARTLLMVIDKFGLAFGHSLPAFEGTPHHALDDAKHEAKIVHLALRHMETAFDRMKP